MKDVKVEIVGETPLLMNNPRSMLFEDEQKSKVISTTARRDSAAEAELRVYKMKDGNLYIPSEAIKGCLVNAASYKKFGKYSAKPIIAGSVRILPSEISLGVKTYEIDIRTVVIQKKSRIIRSRPKVEKWKATFTLRFDEKFIQSGDLVKEILIEGGQRVGLLDFRPQKLGDFGMFKVTKWEEQ